MSRPGSKLAAALELAGRGFSVFPLIHNSKKPLTPNGFKNATRDSAQIEKWWAANPQANIGVATGQDSGLSVVDVDVKNGAKGAESIKQLPLPPTLTVRTPTGGWHLYYRYRTKLPSRNSFLPGIDIKSDGGYVVAPGSVIDGKSYEWVDSTHPMEEIPRYVQDRLAAHPRLPEPEDEEAIREPGRNNRLTQMAGAMRRQGMSESEILAALRNVNKHRCSPPLPEEEVERVAKSVARYAPAIGKGEIDRMPPSVNGQNSFNPSQRGETPWPKDLAPEAFHGVAGDVVNTILPHTEADPAALLLNLLVAFSSAIGRSPHFVVSGAWNFLNLFAVLVGNTASARKGLSWGSIKEIFKAHSSEWLANNLASGLSSGEGLIWRVRDAIPKRDPIKDKGRIISYQDDEADPGVSDKRLLVVEPEFSRVLKAIGRDGSILSVVIREAFDSGDLSTLTKNSPAKSTGASTSILGHITKPELHRNLRESELANGFANRIIWMVVKKSKSLPEGGKLPASEIERLAGRLGQAVSFAQGVGEIKRDDEAREMWAAVYEELGEEKPGMFGAIVGRSQAIVARLSCLYALLDNSVVIHMEHLKSALALWDRAEASTKYIFGMRTGDPIADAIMSALESNGQLDQTEINGLFKGNRSADRIGLALSELKKYGLVDCGIQKTSGRPCLVWYLVGKDVHTK